MKSAVKLDVNRVDRLEKCSQLTSTSRKVQLVDVDQQKSAVFFVDKLHFGRYQPLHFSRSTAVCFFRHALQKYKMFLFHLFLGFIAPESLLIKRKKCVVANATKRQKHKFKLKRIFSGVCKITTAKGRGIFYSEIYSKIYSEKRLDIKIQ